MQRYLHIIILSFSTLANAYTLLVKLHSRCGSSDDVFKQVFENALHQMGNTEKRVLGLIEGGNIQSWCEWYDHFQGRLRNAKRFKIGYYWNPTVPSQCQAEKKSLNIQGFWAKNFVIHVSYLVSLGMHLIRVDSELFHSNTLLSGLKNHKCVAEAELDVLVVNIGVLEATKRSLLEQSALFSWGSGFGNSSGAKVPNDPLVPHQWYLKTVSAFEAWNVTNCNPQIVVALLDTGIDYLHAELTKNLWFNKGEIPENNIDDDQNGYIDDYIGIDLVENSGRPYDWHGHGTGVGGVVGATGNNSYGISGICWNVKLAAIRVLGKDGNGMASAVADGLNYAVGMQFPIANASLGSYDKSNILLHAVQNALFKGMLLVTAAGNEQSSLEEHPFYPASAAIDTVKERPAIDGSIVVAALKSDGRLLEQSNFGSGVDIAAPGDKILSTLPQNRFGYLTGTSFAAPIVSGAAALVWSQHPELTAKDVKQIILKSATINDQIEECQCGRRIINIGAATKCVMLGSNKNGSISCQ